MNMRAASSMLILFVVWMLLPASLSAQEPLAKPLLMRDVFTAMPDSLLPAISRNNRLDCIDFIENGLEAKVRNAFDDYVALEALTPDYARFRTSSVSVMELKLLPQTDSTQVLCVVSTAESGEKGSTTRIEDSTLRLLNADWTPMTDDGAEVSVQRCIDGLDFFDADVADSLRIHYQRAKAAVADFHPVRVHLSAEDATLVLSLQVGQLDVDEKRALSGRVHPITLTWDGKGFNH